MNVRRLWQCLAAVDTVINELLGRDRPRQSTERHRFNNIVLRGGRAGESDASEQRHGLWRIRTAASFRVSRYGCRASPAPFANAHLRVAGRPGQIPPPFGMPGAPGRTSLKPSSSHLNKMTYNNSAMGGNRGGMPLPFPPPGGFPAMPGQPPFPFPPPGGFTGAAASPNNAMPFPPPGGLPPPSQAMGFLPFGGPSPSPGLGVSVPPGMGGPMGR